MVSNVALHSHSAILLSEDVSHVDVHMGVAKRGRLEQLPSYPSSRDPDSLEKNKR